MDKRTVGERIRDLREGRELTQEALAQAIGIRQASVADWESGKSKAPSAKNLTKVARVFEVDPEWLMTGKGPQHPVSSLGDDESELILLFRTLSPESRQYVLGRARSVHRDEHENPRADESADDSQPMRRPAPPRRPN